jgi:hypothetical protein
VARLSLKDETGWVQLNHSPGWNWLALAGRVPGLSRLVRRPGGINPTQLRRCNAAATAGQSTRNCRSFRASSCLYGPRTWPASQRENGDIIWQHRQPLRAQHGRHGHHTNTMPSQPPAQAHVVCVRPAPVPGASVQPEIHG